MLEDLSFGGGKGVSVFQKRHFEDGLLLAQETVNEENEHEESFSHTNWPPRSPELHHIESYWDSHEKTTEWITHVSKTRSRAKK